MNPRAEINPKNVTSGLYEFDVAFQVPLPQAAGAAALEQTLVTRLHIPEDHNLTIKDSKQPPVGSATLYDGKTTFVNFEQDSPDFGVRTADIGIAVTKPGLVARALARVTRNRYKPKVWVTATAAGSNPDDGGESVKAPDPGPLPLPVGAY